MNETWNIYQAYEGGVSNRCDLHVMGPGNFIKKITWSLVRAISYIPFHVHVYSSYLACKYDLGLWCVAYHYYVTV